MLRNSLIMAVLFAATLLTAAPPKTTSEEACAWPEVADNQDVFEIRPLYSEDVEPCKNPCNDNNCNDWVVTDQADCPINPQQPCDPNLNTFCMKKAQGGFWLSCADCPRGW
jgi:hypothetical protein